MIDAHLLVHLDIVIRAFRGNIAFHPLGPVEYRNATPLPSVLGYPVKIVSQECPGSFV